VVDISEQAPVSPADDAQATASARAAGLRVPSYVATASWRRAVRIGEPAVGIHADLRLIPNPTHTASAPSSSPRA
jgi:hypothetical protein